MSVDMQAIIRPLWVKGPETSLVGRDSRLILRAMSDIRARTVCFSLVEALSSGPPPAGNLAVPIFVHGSLVAELYSPQGTDPQQPHDRDEVYLVARGTSLFFDGVSRHALETGSFVFVGAGREHRFEDFSKDFAVWVFFYGPTGGEANPI